MATDGVIAQNAARGMQQLMYINVHSMYIKFISPAKKIPVDAAFCHIVATLTSELRVPC